ncbi:MAG TPA: hypothetical protein VFJ57_11700 [Solirubrobacterales bacterium]|nr:hypothetical protein [Solirubrobacterales bacterium]
MPTQLEVSNLGAEILAIAGEQASGRSTSWMATCLGCSDAEAVTYAAEMADAGLLERVGGTKFRATAHGREALEAWNSTTIDRESAALKQARRHW